MSLDGRLDVGIISCPDLLPRPMGIGRRLLHATDHACCPTWFGATAFDYSVEAAGAAGARCDHGNRRAPAGSRKWTFEVGDTGFEAVFRVAVRPRSMSLDAPPLLAPSGACRRSGATGYMWVCGLRRGSSAASSSRLAVPVLVIAL